MNKSIVASLILLAVLTIGIFLILPKYQELKAFKIKIDEKRDELQYKEEYFSDLQETSDRLKDYKEELEKIESALPDNPSLPSFFNFLQKATSQNGLILKNLGSFSIVLPSISSVKKTVEEKATEKNVKETEKKIPKVKKISLAIEVSGSYSSFKNFLESLEKSARLIEVENISFSSPKPGEETFSYTLKLKTFSY